MAGVNILQIFNIEFVLCRNILCEKALCVCVHCAMQDEWLDGGSEHSTNFFLWFTTSQQQSAEEGMSFNNKNFDFDQCNSISDYPVSIKIKYLYLLKFQTINLHFFVQFSLFFDLDLISTINQKWIMLLLLLYF